MSVHVYVCVCVFVGNCYIVCIYMYTSLASQTPVKNGVWSPLHNGVVTVPYIVATNQIRPT